MPGENFFNNKIKQALPAYMGKTSSILNKPVILGFLAFAILAALFTILIYQRFLIVKEAKKKEAYDIVNTAKDKLQEALAYGSSATRILSFFIDNSGTVKNFDSIAAEIMNTNKDIDVLELVPDGVIRYVYPLQGNEAVLGYDILKDSARNKEAYKAIEKKGLFFSGPYALKQGSPGIVGRLPVFRNKKFWGFSAVVIKLSTLLKAAGIDSVDGGGNYFQLSKINPDTKREEFFIPYQKEYSQDYSVSVNIPDGEWKLSVKQVSGYKGFADIFILALLGFVISVLGGIFIFNQAGRPKRLDDLVKERTRQLKESDERFSKAFHSNVVGFAIYDSDFRIIDINEPYAQVLESSRQKLIGKTSEEAGLISKISSERRDMISQEIEVILNTEGQLQNFETEIITNEGEAASILLSIEPLELNNKPYWLTSVIDITANKKAELLMTESEEKYRTLIEQASDGIIITTLDGNIIEVNNSVCLMSGYDEHEMLGEHLYKFLPAEDAVTNPLRFKELMEGKSLLYERRLLKKDGTTLDIEVNSKMASSHTMIGFFRDISERKKSEETLRYQARLLESVSDAVTSLDMNRCIVSWNKACEELYGFKPEDALGKRIPQLVTFDFPGTTAEEVFKQVYGSGTWKGEFNFVHPQTKSITHLLSSINSIKNKEGNITGFIITSKDITERKKAENALEESFSVLEATLESTADGILVANSQGKIIRFNKKFAELWRIPQEILTTGDDNKAIDFVLDQLKSPENFLAKIKELYAQPEAVSFDTLEFKDGRVVERYSQPQVVNGQSLGRVWSFRDITERRKAEEELQLSEQKYRLLFYNNPLPMWMATIPGLDIIDVNDAAILQYGYTREEFLKLNTRDLRPAEDVENFLAEVNKMNPGVINIRAWRHKKKDGTIIHVETYSHQILYEGKQVWLGLSHDVTENYNAKQLLQRSYEEIRQLASNLQSIREDERTNIAREIHDELGQQLTGLKMDIHWLSRKIKNEDQEINDKVRESIELINATITSVRKIATDLRPSILDDLGLMAALEWQGEEFEKRSGTKVKFINKAGDLFVRPEVATGIFRIYQELLTNIARHANARLVTASLHIEENILRFSIKDDGVGFNADTIGSKKTLGLLGIKERTLLMGGTYDIKTEPGKGSETIISIPFHLTKATG